MFCLEWPNPPGLSNTHYQCLANFMISWLKHISTECFSPKYFYHKFWKQTAKQDSESTMGTVYRNMVEIIESMKILYTTEIIAVINYNFWLI